MADLNSLAQSAQTLIDQLNAGSITFQNFQNSVSSLSTSLQSLTVTTDEDMANIHTVHEAESIAAGEAPIINR
mgnify:CR=1 FL=1